MIMYLYKQIKGSFLPEAARNELVLFLWSNDASRNYLVIEIAKNKLMQKGKLAGGQKLEPDNKDIIDFMNHNAEAIESEARKALRAMARQFLPGFNWTVIFKHIGLFAFCLVPSIYVLFKVAYEAFGVDGTVFCASGVALLFLVVLLIAVGTSLILDSLRNRSP